MVTSTTNVGLKKPAVGGDIDAWAGYLNDNEDALESWLYKCSIPFLIASPANGTYKLIVSMRHPGTITSVTTISVAGTCTLQGKINTTALGGTINSVSISETAQTHATNNNFIAGDDISVTISGVSACTNLSGHIYYTRTGAGT